MDPLDELIAALNAHLDAREIQTPDGETPPTVFTNKRLKEAFRKIVPAKVRHTTRIDTEPQDAA